MRRTTKTITFQPTDKILNKIKPPRKKLPHGHVSRTINRALEHYFSTGNHATT